jgi:transcriptional regulator with XRE-family HTH domain
MTANCKSPPEAPANSARALLARRLRDWRKSKGFLLKQVASEFGVAEATWDRWETGSRFPEPETLRRLSEFIGAPMCSFFYPGWQDCAACVSPAGRCREYVGGRLPICQK